MCVNIRIASINQDQRFDSIALTGWASNKAGGVALTTAARCGNWRGSTRLRCLGNFIMAGFDFACLIGVEAGFYALGMPEWQQ
jgi:hypothetical protein